MSFSARSQDTAGEAMTQELALAFAASPAPRLRPMPYAMPSTSPTRQIAVRRQSVVLPELLAELNRLNQLEPNWDGEAAAAITPRAIGEARQILSNALGSYPLLERSLRPFFVVPSPDGGVDLEWRSGQRSVEIAIDPDGTIAFLTADRTGERPRFHEHHGVSRQQAVSLITGFALAPYGA